MPDIVVHTAMGREVLGRLGLGVDFDVFRFGLLGPDPFLFWGFRVPPFRHAVNRYSSVMHRQRTGEFLMELARRSQGRADVFAWLCGFLCHYALDADTHPYIIEKAGGNPFMHMAVEHRLDNLMGGGIDIPPFLPGSMASEVSGAIGAVYGWPDAWSKLRRGHRDMAPFYRLARDEHGRLDRLLGWTRGGPAALSYKSGICEGMDLDGFWPLYRRAIDDGVRYVRAADAFARGVLDEAALRRVIGSRSYIEG